MAVEIRAAVRVVSRINFKVRTDFRGEKIHSTLGWLSLGACYPEVGYAGLYCKVDPLKIHFNHAPITVGGT